MAGGPLLDGDAELPRLAGGGRDRRRAGADAEAGVSEAQPPEDRRPAIHGSRRAAAGPPAAGGARGRRLVGAEVDRATLRARTAVEVERGARGQRRARIDRRRAGAQVQVAGTGVDEPGIGRLVAGAFGDDAGAGVPGAGSRTAKFEWSIAMRPAAQGASSRSATRCSTSAARPRSSWRPAARSGSAAMSARAGGASRAGAWAATAVALMTRSVPPRGASAAIAAPSLPMARASESTTSPSPQIAVQPDALTRRATAGGPASWRPPSTYVSSTRAVVTTDGGGVAVAMPSVRSTVREQLGGRTDPRARRVRRARQVRLLDRQRAGVGGVDADRAADHRRAHRRGDARGDLQRALPVATARTVACRSRCRRKSSPTAPGPARWSGRRRSRSASGACAGRSAPSAAASRAARVAACSDDRSEAGHAIKGTCRGTSRQSGGAAEICAAPGRWRAPPAARGGALRAPPTVRRRGRRPG